MTLAEYTDMVQRATAQLQRGIITWDELQQRLLVLAAALFGHMD